MNPVPAPLAGVDALTENDVIEYVCRYLEADGFVIEQRLHTSQKGHDIIARRSDGGVRLFIEAKGATSASESSRRYGKRFNSSQGAAHVSRALFAALQTLSRGDGDASVRVGIALPHTTLHRRLVDSALVALKRLDIAIFWVDGSGTVIEE